MKSSLLLQSLYFILTASNCLAQPAAKSESLLIGVFDGRTPCQELAAMMNEKPIPECIKIKWRISFYRDPSTEDSGTYEMLGYIFRNGHTGKGVWHKRIGTKADPQAIVYQLDLQGGTSFWLQKADDNIFLFLDKDKQLMVGNRDFSYTLNRKPASAK